MWSVNTLPNVGAAMRRARSSGETGVVVRCRANVVVLVVMSGSFTWAGDRGSGRAAR